MEFILQEYLKETFDKEKKMLKEQTLIESYHKKPVNYFGTINEELGKFGCTKDINRRVQEHKREIGDTFTIECVIECEQHEELEQKFKDHNDISNRRISKSINGKLQTELIRLDDYLQVNDIKKIMATLKQTITVDKDLLVMKHKEKMSELENIKFELENIKIKEITRQKELDLEMRKLEMQVHEPLKEDIVSSQAESLPIKVNKTKKTKWNVKSQLSGSEEEKLKFRNWLNEHLEQSETGVLAWSDLIKKYMTKTSPLIASIYKDYFEEYIKEKYKITDIYKSIRVNRTKTVRGWRCFVVKD